MGQYIGFRLGGSEYAVPILEVREIVNVPAMTRLPQAPDGVEGVTNLRGSVIPVVDAKKLMGIGGGNGWTKVIVVGAGARTFGMLVDGITGVVAIDASSIEPPERFRNGKGDSIAGVAKLSDRLVVLLDAAKLLPGDHPASSAGEPVDPGAEGEPAEDRRQTGNGAGGVADRASGAGAAEGDPGAPELRAARELIARKAGGADGRNPVVDAVLGFMEAVASRDYARAEALADRIAGPSPTSDVKR